MANGVRTRLQKHILIRVDGSHALGLGHIYRMKTLATALDEAGYGISFLTKEDSCTHHLLQATGLKIYTFRTDSYEEILHQAVHTEQPALILQDILDTSAEAMRLLRARTSARIINFDDAGAGLTMADAVINSIIFHYATYTRADCQVPLFEGPQYMILQPSITQFLHRSKYIPVEADNILLTFGGTDTHSITERALEAINMIPVPLAVTINLGPGSYFTPRLKQAIQDSTHHVVVLNAVPHLFAEFYRADIVVCAGGNTLYELAALGVPSIAIAAEPHEINNIRYWSQIGTTVCAAWENTLALDKLAKLVQALRIDDERRRSMSFIGKHAVDAQGLNRVRNIIEEVLD